MNPQAKQIRVGERFNSFAEFQTVLNDYEKSNFANYSVSKSALDQDRENLKYSFVKYCCKLFGDYVSTSTTRKTSSYKQGCASYIYVLQKEEENHHFLIITAMHEHHNHERSADLFNHMVKQRKQALENQREHIENVLVTKPNLRAVQKQVNIPGSGVITLKDIHNFKAHLKQNATYTQNDLVQLIEVMMKIENASVKVFTNEQEQLDLVSFQDDRMKAFFNAYPELLMFDGTYKLNNLRMPVVILLVVDGNGESQVVGLAIVRSENDDSFRNFFEEFKKENPRHVDIQVIMSDKSFANRNAFRAAFPNAKHQLCVFHVLQIFIREVTTAKRNLTVAQKDEAIRILRRMVYANSQAEYDNLYRALRNIRSTELMAYFNDNWHNIIEQWVGFKVNQHANYENRTNNRLESLNQKIKSIVSKYSSLATFFDDLMTCIASFNLERDHVAADAILRRSLPTVNDTVYDAKYSKYLTKYAFDKYKLQSMRSANVRFESISDIDGECIEHNVLITVDDNTCSCNFYNTMKLPCAHIIAFLKEIGEDPFKPTLCANRWKKENAQFISEFQYSAPSTSQSEVITTQSTRRRNMQPNEKFRAAQIETNKICEILAEKRQNEFDQWFLKLKELRECVENDTLPNFNRSQIQGELK